MSRIERREVRTYKERLFCDCGEEMVAEDYVLTSNPPKYPHICPACHTIVHITGFSYPHITYEEVAVRNGSDDHEAQQND